MSGSIYTSKQSSFINEQQEVWSSISRVNPFISVKVSIPSMKTWKLFRQPTSDTLWNLKTNLLKRIPDLSSRFQDCWNWGFLYDRAGDDVSLRSSVTNLSKVTTFASPQLKVFLDDSKTFEQLHLHGEVNFAFCSRFRITHLEEKKYKKINSKNARKKFLNYLASQNDKKLGEMLQKGFDPNFVTEDNLTPLILAMKMEDSSSITLLLHFGAFPDFRTPDQKTPLHWAALNDKAFSISMLVKWGSNPNIYDDKGSTPLHCACSKGFTECVEQLLRGHASPHIHDVSGRSPLHLAVLGHADCLSLLLEAGANIHDTNRLGNTPLHIAASMNEMECALLLLKKGANKDALNLAGKTAEQMAISGNFLKLAESIKSFKPILEPEIEQVEQPGRESPLTKSTALRPISRTSSTFSETSLQTLSRKKCAAPLPPTRKQETPTSSSLVLEAFLESLHNPSPKNLFRKFHDSKLLSTTFSPEQSKPTSSCNTVNYILSHASDITDETLLNQTEKNLTSPLSSPASPLPPPVEFDFSSLTPLASIPESTYRPAQGMEPRQDLFFQSEMDIVEAMSSLSLQQFRLFQSISDKNHDLKKTIHQLTCELEQYRRDKGNQR